MIDTSDYTYWTPVVILTTGEEIHADPIHEQEIAHVQDAYVDGIRNGRRGVAEFVAQGDIWVVNIPHIVALGFEPHH